MRLTSRGSCSAAPLTPARLKSAGPFFVCRRVGLLPPGRGAFRSVCPRCASPIFLPERLLGRWAESGAALVCARCAGTRPGRILGHLPPAS